MGSLIVDGYPSEARLTILSMAICEVIAAEAADADHLGEGIALRASAIDRGSRLAFEQRHSSKEER